MNATLQDMLSQSKKKVYVGLSGGVDSSVSAALLKDAGYDVAGVFIKVWQPDWFECTWREDRLDAMRVAAKLDIPFITLDLENEYKKEVVDYMVSEYKAGRTPNPDVMCNRYVKFGGFFDWALAQGADFVATGHYASVAKTNSGYELKAGKDVSKDQSYFLWTLTQKHLEHTLFPVGEIEKTEVRKLAEKYELSTATKKDSQGLCFIGKVDIDEFLGHYIEKKKGDVLNEKGEVIGEHNGAVFYTLGERHGFTITVKTPDETPYYVIAKDIEKNTITVSHKKTSQELSVEKNKVELVSVNWVSRIPSFGESFTARVRYRQELASCTLAEAQGFSVSLVFDTSQVFAPGQSIVMYKDGVCLGGGIIR